MFYQESLKVLFSLTTGFGFKSHQKKNKPKIIFIYEGLQMKNGSSKSNFNCVDR